MDVKEFLQVAHQFIEGDWFIFPDLFPYMFAVMVLMGAALWLIDFDLPPDSDKQKNELIEKPKHYIIGDDGEIEEIIDKGSE